jgi:hypothetical protein
VNTVENMKQFMNASMFTSLFICASVVAGCHSYDVNGESPVRYANSVQVIAYDRETRSPAKSIQVFDSPTEIKQPYHVIALLLRNGKPNDEGLILKALIWRARHEGADGVILLGAQGGGGQEGFLFGNRNGLIGTSSPSEPVYHAQAIVFDKPN